MNNKGEARHTLLDSTTVRAWPRPLSWPTGDRGPFVAVLATRNICALILPRRKRRRPRAYDAACYAQHHPGERLFSRLEPFRRVATRYNKLDAHFLALVPLAAAASWLRDG